MSKARDLADLPQGSGGIEVDGNIKLDGNYPVGTGNVALGDTALDSNVSGGSNTAIGGDALTANTASNNTAVGYQAGYSNSTGTNSVFIGRQAGYSTTTVNAVTAVGDIAGYANTTGQITAVGYAALNANTTASANTAVGVGALRFNTTGGSNTAVGDSALNVNTTASENTAVGYQALYSNTTGTPNNALGRQALRSNTTGNANSALGEQALQANTTGGYNCAFGNLALSSNTTSSSNTAVGFRSGLNTTTGSQNTFIGADSGNSHTNGTLNTFVGADAGYYVTTGSKNTIIGKYNGNQGGLDIRTDSNNIVLSDGDGNSRVHVDENGVCRIARLPGGQEQPGFMVVPNDYMAFTNTSTDSGDRCLILNRESSDGLLVEFRQNTSVEGTISVSGSTVSYNGGHLARWSQLLDGSHDADIVKGTVLSNLDEMAEWTNPNTGQIEDNEQLNRMKVSEVEGDTNVGAVFVNWEIDVAYGTNDMNVAMTGDMVIRIAQGTTVARGDLLMSAGDGTAKPQGDDIVRSKTIAKVTSTHVSHTYDDGSYLVPCVLMAC